MASGSLFLADGRCFAVRWVYYDKTMRAIAEELSRLPNAEALRDWFLKLLPGPDDEEELGYGAWFRKADQQVVSKSLDLRELTAKNQQLFQEAAKRAGRRAASPEAANWDRLFVDSLRYLTELIERTERGEPPLAGTGASTLKPPSGKRTGPGWEGE